ncbi:hypothetical protein EBR21_18150 [bacterium]|nr:hypothetical protein [bacterium]
MVTLRIEIRLRLWLKPDLRLRFRVSVMLKGQKKHFRLSGNLVRLAGEDGKLGKNSDTDRSKSGAQRTG